jgi:glyoxylase-like metal-dependent hydrolase (beta-lactamase superfamily II)
MQTFVIDDGRRRLLVDTSIGNDKQRSLATLSGRRTNFLDRLADVGVTCDDVDVVMCTHVHADHVGWNTVREDGEWLPTFRIARYALPGEDVADLRRGIGTDAAAILTDSIDPVIATGQGVDARPGDQVSESVHLVPSPGHIAGHVSVWIESDGAAALITGDAIHHPVQARPDWGALRRRPACRPAHPARPARRCADAVLSVRISRARAACASDRHIPDSG